MINLIKKWLISLGSPPFFFSWASKFLSWFYPISFLLLLTGLIWGIGFAPSDYKQGEVYRIIFIHVPSAILGQSVYLMMAIFGSICLIWRAKLAGMFLRSAAPLGASFPRRELKHWTMRSGGGDRGSAVSSIGRLGPCNRASP